MEQKSLNEYTLQDFIDMEIFYNWETFNNIVIVPTDEIHESGYRCMKFVLWNNDHICGVVGGYSDVIYPNGIGNHGDPYDMFTGKIPHMGLSMDCLRESGCMRIMMSYPCKLTVPLLSSFKFYCVYDEGKSS